jgi:acetylornithine deacetylase
MLISASVFTDLLRQLIATPSVSREEANTAVLLEGFLEERGVAVHRVLNNVYAFNRHFDAGKQTVLLNSHHDTVAPNKGYTRGPFDPVIEDGRLYGLGSNDAGGPLVALMAAFLYFYDRADLPCNLCLAATAEEECSGKNGIEQVLPRIPNLWFAIVGEPTQMHLAVAEKGLMVLDCTAIGKAGHAAREEGINAIYEALADIEWIRHFDFPKVSPYLGKVTMSVTVIEAGLQHNMVPEYCRFTVDVRATELYTLEEILATLRQHLKAEVVPRSMRLRPSFTPTDHPFVRAGQALGRQLYGSPTLSDQALLPCASVKIGPGDSARSHTANEYIEIGEIEEGIVLYIEILERFFADLHNKTTAMNTSN